MSTYIVTFEVSSPQAREKLVAKLGTYPGYCPVNAHCWAISSPQTAAQICDVLKQDVGGQDRIFVIRSGTEGAWINSYGEDHTKWLKNNL